MIQLIKMHKYGEAYAVAPVRGTYEAGPGDVIDLVGSMDSTASAAYRAVCLIKANGGKPMIIECGDVTYVVDKAAEDVWAYDARDLLVHADLTDVQRDAILADMPCVAGMLHYGAGPLIPFTAPISDPADITLKLPNGESMPINGNDSTVQYCTGEAEEQLREWHPAYGDRTTVVYGSGLTNDDHLVTVEVVAYGHPLDIDIDVDQICHDGYIEADLDEVEELVKAAVTGADRVTVTVTEY